MNTKKNMRNIKQLKKKGYIGEKKEESKRQFFY